MYICIICTIRKIYFAVTPLFERIKFVTGNFAALLFTGNLVDDAEADSEADAAALRAFVAVALVVVAELIR